MGAYAGMLMIVFLVALAIGIAATRLSIMLSHRLDILDRPDPRKAHRAPIAYLGGLGMFIASLCGLLTFTVLNPDVLIEPATPVYAICAGALMIYLVGFWDDVRPIPAFVKLGLQVGVAAFMWFNGIQISQIAIAENSLTNVGSWISAIITIGWYVALMNSVNLVDGLDGLAGGICFLGALSLVGVGMVLGMTPDVLLGASLAAIVAGVTLGYLRYNWSPAQTFMGDGGSLLLGFLLATSSLVGSTKTPTLLALSVPLVALGLPLFESSFSFLRRAAKGQHPFKPDRRHLHHRLLDLGLTQRRVVVVLLFLTAVLGINAVILAQSGLKILFFNVLFLVAGIMLLIENLKYLEVRRLESGEGSGGA